MEDTFSEGKKLIYHLQAAADLLREWCAPDERPEIMRKFLSTFMSQAEDHGFDLLDDPEGMDLVLQVSNMANGIYPRR